MKCRCGCEGEAVWLITGIDYGARTAFTDDPACAQATSYCEEAAAELGLPFSKRLAPGAYDVLFGSRER